jgi:hypothetical protein
MIFLSFVYFLESLNNCLNLFSPRACLAVDTDKWARDRSSATLVLDQVKMVDWEGLSVAIAGDGDSEAPRMIRLHNSDEDSMGNSYMTAPPKYGHRSDADENHLWRCTTVSGDN